MKPNFALDLSHDGINLLHRSKGGWHLVGSVALDDPDVGGRLEELHRSAAMLESSGITTKIIIPDSQILYTTVDAPGPDDIAREVQIRTALDGLTPYPVGELVFDRRAQGDKARVAVLARETMDEAEGFAAQYMFTPVSFVARPGRGVFSGEPFFGRSRASAKILPPGERIEPDATPVPHNPGAATLPESAGVLPPDAPEAEPPLAENAPGAVPEPTTAPLPDATMAQPTATTAPAVEDDSFAELDQIAAELSGDEINAPAQEPRPKPSRKRKSGTQSVTPPQLAPFPPTPDEIDEAPMSVPHPVAPRLAAGPPVAPPANPSQPASALRPMSAPGPDPSPSPDAVPFSSTRKSDPGAAGTPRTPTTRLSGLAPRIGVPEETTQAPTVSPSTGPVTPPAAPPVTPTPSPQGSSGTVPTAKMPPLHGDRLRAEMAEALAKPLPRAGEQSTKRAQKGPGALARLGAAARGAMAARAERRAQQKSEAAEAALAQTQPAPKPATSDDRGARKGLLRRRSAPTKADQKRDAEAEALTVFGARKGQTQPDRPKYLGLILTLVLLILMAAVALWSGYV
ncbi:MAG TPA: hypothetical protein ENK80_06800, partial [Rhodobacterales bacterium]|nr:hypothetical protein [Rhodobacterales bacterium]